ncbi:MerR family transcriptional regulator [Sporosarcina sp. P37]|uniref:MerR family transcriptional regulator n=2 Tax=unclassified Sporosarcina TaxID=2647733 RepID=UPI0018DEA5AF|nr:MerR family transcriptional regulator [Sporosarcina sp. P37]
MKTSEIASRLGLETVTIRKYCLELEKRGFVFQRNDGKNRDFTSDDLHALSQMKHLIEVAKMSRIAAANVVVAGHGTPNDMLNEPPSVSVSLVKTDETMGMDEVQRYLEQQDDLIRNVQDVNNAVILMKEMMVGFQQQLATVSEENHALKEVKRSQYTTEFLTVHRLKIKLRKEAEALWQLEPEEKRLIKRWFRKSEENHIEKDRFIQKFVDANLEKSLKTEINY